MSSLTCRVKTSPVKCIMHAARDGEAWYGKATGRFSGLAALLHAMYAMSFLFVCFVKCSWTEISCGVNFCFLCNFLVMLYVTSHVHFRYIKIQNLWRWRIDSNRPIILNISCKTLCMCYARHSIYTWGGASGILNQWDKTILINKTTLHKEMRELLNDGRLLEHLV